MNRAIIASACLLASSLLWGSDEKKPRLPSFDFEAARTHELKPHRWMIPIEGVRPWFGQLYLRLTVSPAGDVVDARAEGEDKVLALWPKVQGEVYQWKFTPFEKEGKAVTAEVEEFVNLVPPELFPKRHVVPPAVRPDSKVEITLTRTGCFGTCAGYTVTVANSGIIFVGNYYTVAGGRHAEVVDAAEVRKLARRFIAADIFSMDRQYGPSGTDMPTYELSISVDGRKKKVVDNDGQSVGMPEIIHQLEREVDEFARTARWVEGAEGLVAALRAEGFDFHSYQAQELLKESAARNEAATVQELLGAGVPLEPLPESEHEKKERPLTPPRGGWLVVASDHPDALKVLIRAGASNEDQGEKDLALTSAANFGNVEAIRALIAYGANPNVDLSESAHIELPDGTTRTFRGIGSILIGAAASGKPDAVREILKYGPKLEVRGGEKGGTALSFAAHEPFGDKNGRRVECVSLLVQAGANINARDEDGNTPLHLANLADVEEELLKLGADVNARNAEGETPIFTTVGDDAIPLFIKYGADLSIRNNKGQTVLEAAERHGPTREEVLRNAMQKLK